MLEQVLGFIHNWFVKEKYYGDFTIESGIINLLFLKEGQYFRIVKSDLNDGVYKYPATDLQDETFTGEIWALSIPKNLLSLTAEIEDWQAKYGDASASPYQSESFGGYSYSKASGTSGANGIGGGLTGWQAQFAAALNQYRKIG